jgi:hypothetical protein
VTTEAANSLRNIIGTGRLNINLPTGLSTGNYFITIADTAAGDADFNTAAGNCTEVQVTGSSAVLNACVAGSSLGVLLPAANARGTVTAYVPKGFWSGSQTGVFVQNIEGPAAPFASVATPNVVNSCSSNPATGQTVCVANNTDVYLLTGTALNTTLTQWSHRNRLIQRGNVSKLRSRSECGE